MVPARRMKAFVTQVGVAQREGARLALAATARSEEARVIREQKARAGGIAPTLTRIVDGRRGASYDTVRENGLIILQWRYMREIASVAVARLQARAPERSGAYKRGIRAFVDGSEAGLSAGGIPVSAQRVSIVATVPYARRLELGRDAKGGPFVVQVKPHIVAETAALLARDYKGVATIRFTFEEIDGPSRAERRPRGATRGERRAQRAQDVAIRFPSISVVDFR